MLRCESGAGLLPCSSSSRPPLPSFSPCLSLLVTLDHLVIFFVFSLSKILAIYVISSWPSFHVMLPIFLKSTPLHATPPLSSRKLNMPLMKMIKLVKKKTKPHCPGLTDPHMMVSMPGDGAQLCTYANDVSSNDK